MKTKAHDGITDTQTGARSKNAVIIDTVSYTNLKIGKESTITGTLMNKETGKPLKADGKEITSEVTFTAEKSKGSIEMKFTVDSTALEGKTTVVFEDLYMGSINLATHADIRDDGQSIHWSKIHTTAKDKKTGNQTGTISRWARIVDTVSYTNLIPGNEYTVKGVLMNKETGKPLKEDGKTVTAEETFKPEKADGSVELTFKLDSRALEKKTVVVFEDLYHKQIQVATHSDIKDKDQSINYPEVPKIPHTSIPKTGDETHMLLYGALMAASATALAALRRKRAQELKDEDSEE